MGRAPVPPPVPVPRLIPALVGADPAVLARESTSHADAILRQGDQVAAAQDAAEAAGTAAQASVAALAVTVAGIRPGRLLATPAILTGAGSGVLPAGTCVVHLRGIGQGGGGGGAQSAGGVSAGAGGSSGVLLDIWIGTPGVPLSTLAYSWAAGSGAGGGGSTAGGNGAAGADSTATINGVVYTMKGGGGGAGCPNIVAPNNGNVMATAPAAGTSAGGLTCYGQGRTGIVIAGAAWFSGQGGGVAPFGSGGESVGGASDGLAGAGFGGGGSGGAGSGGVGHVGGAGAPGGFTIEGYS